MRPCPNCAATADDSAQFCPACGAELGFNPAASLLGVTIDGQFEVKQLLGGGAFGTVYRAHQTGLDRPCAIKVPTHEIAADPVMAKRFAREARSAARVIHPGVVQIYAVGELPDRRPYLAMQLVDGEPLDRCLANGPISPVRALRIVRAIASALSDTHAAGVVHRDLKPTNIIWRKDRNGDDRITLVDFGIAACKPTAGVDATKLTDGGLIGTPHYMSPEQAHGDAVDARADLYALGILLFELVTGKTPFEGSTIEVMLAHLSRKPPAPSELEASVPEAVDRICESLLAKRPENRPASADELVTMLDLALGDLDGGRSQAERSSLTRGARALAKKRTLATRRDLPYDVDPPRRAPRWLAVAGAVGILVAGTGFGALVLGKDHPAAASMADAAHSEPADQPNGPTHTGPGARDIFRDDGGIVLHVLVPQTITVGSEVRPHLEIKNKLGQPVIADSIVVTITDDNGAAKGLTAHPHGDGGGHYDFHYSFPAAGHYVMRVFPPSIDSAFAIDVDVAG